MLLDRLAHYLAGDPGRYSYILDSPRIEIWVEGKEWFPIIISAINEERYVVSWGELEYQFKDEEKAYQYVLRLCRYINESLQDIQSRVQ